MFQYPEGQADPRRDIIKEQLAFYRAGSFNTPKGKRIREGAQ